MAERLFEDCSAFAEVGATVIDWDEFERVEMRVGRILAVDDFSEARKPSYLLTIDFGLDLGVRRSSVAIRDLYRKEELVGRLVVAVTNFPPKQIANHMSQALVLAAVNRDGTMRLLQPDAEVELGARIR
ncbi:MAG TPA: tRNA-binding protein [Anaerolineales bacterium]|nr:tRNA-binding protein [Anaerolineales bacterium]